MLDRFFKTLIVEAMNKKLCYGCTRRLDKQVQREPIDTETEIVHCQCGKTYTYDRLHRKYDLYVEPRTQTYYV